MPGLVLEGGGFRGVFTQGVLDALLDHNVMFPYVIGVSAGICNGFSYINGQRGRNWEIAEKYYNDKRYYSYGNYFKNGSVFGLKFMYETVPNELIPYDYEALKKYQGTALIGVTHGITGQPRYLTQDPDDRTNIVLQATCSIPFFFPPVEIDGEDYFDGGVADPIPIKKSVEDGNEKNLIVLTQPKGYIKTPSKTNKRGSKLLRRDYPGTAEVMTKRHQIYNQQLTYCSQLAREGKAVVLYPKRATVVGRFERNINKLRLLYEDGYVAAKTQIEEIKNLF
ncbi:MAG: patatin family protein [Bacillota bacterium]|nr:patatin family protein [Bacillota bacterium]